VRSRLWLSILLVEVDFIFGSADGFSGQPTESATPYLTITVSAAADSSSHKTAVRHSPVIEGGATRPSVSSQSNSESVMSANPVSPFSRASDLPVESEARVEPVVDSPEVMSRTLDRAEDVLDTVRTWKTTLEIIQRVMDTVGPVLEVCPMFSLLTLF
jgi:hypothetical protein